MLTVLVVEDDDYLRRALRRFLREFANASTLEAATRDAALALFRKHQTAIDLILMDACVPGTEPNTMSIVGRFRYDGYKGLIVGMSGEPVFSQKLVEAGADLGLKKGVELFEEIKKVLAELAKKKHE